MYRNIFNTLLGKEEYLVKEHQNMEVIKAIEWDGLIPALEAGQIDAILQGGIAQQRLG